MPPALLSAIGVRSKSRDAGLDIARGIAMVLVVFGHAMDGAQSAGHADPALRFLILVVYSTHIALFFQVSGLLSRGLRDRPWPDFLGSLLGRIVWPYILWSFVIVTVHFAMSDYTNTSSQGYAPYTILWRAPAVMWFLYVLCAAMLVLRVLAPLPLAVTFVVGAVLLLAPYMFGIWPNNSRFVGMFLIAAAAGPKTLEIALKPVIVVIAAATMAGTIWIAAVQAQESITGYPGFQASFLPAVFAGPMLVYRLSTLISQRGPKGWLQDLLVLIGRNTMAIFVTHILVTAGTRIVLVRVGVTDWWIVILLATIAGVALPLIAALLAKRWGVATWLGWR